MFENSNYSQPPIPFNMSPHTYLHTIHTFCNYNSTKNSICRTWGTQNVLPQHPHWMTGGQQANRRTNVTATKRTTTAAATCIEWMGGNRRAADRPTRRASRPAGSKALMSVFKMCHLPHTPSWAVCVAKLFANRQTGTGPRRERLYRCPGK